MKISAIICAAGDGKRLNSANPTTKQYLVVNGKSIIEYSLDKFIELDIIEYIVNSSVYLSFVISYTLM